MRKNRFLYSHEYRDIKMEGKKRAKQFLKIDTNSASENCWEKKPEKLRKNVFCNHTTIVTKNWGGKKRAKQFFQKHKNSSSKKCWEKNRRKKVRKTFF